MRIATPEKTYKHFNRAFFKDLMVLVKPFWQSEHKKKAYRYLAINLICLALVLYASVALNQITKTLYDALAEFNHPVLMQSTGQFLMIAVLIFFCKGYSSYYNGLLTLNWQKWMTEDNIAKWLGEQSHYRMRWLNHRIDNADQRISEDLASFPALTLRLLFRILDSVGSYVSFSVILWNLSKSYSLTWGTFHLHLPGFLFYAATGYGIIGLWLTGVIGKRLAGIQYLQQQLGANFRQKLLSIREFGEQIASFRGEKVEQNRLNQLFGQVYDTAIRANIVSKNLVFFTAGYEIVSSIIGLFLSIPMFLAKKVQLGGMVQISGAFRTVSGSFADIIEWFSVLAEWKAVVFRITEFQQGISDANTITANLKRTSGMVQHVQLKDIVIQLPEGRILSNISELSFAAPNRYLISGETGCGKSTLFRVLMGLWPTVDGEMTQPDDSQFFLLPQRTYIPYGCLKDVLTYPDLSSINDKYLIDVMKNCGLERFTNALHVERNWSQVLSLGQQQLVGFVRLFLRCPQVILLDESTSALDEMMEKRMYRLLDEYFPEALVISIGHRGSLLAYHQHHIVLPEVQSINTQQVIEVI